MTGAPRLLLGTVLLLMVGQLPALEISADVGMSDGVPQVRCRIDGVDPGELFRSLDGGGTARIFWQFRLGSIDTNIIRYARRDSLGEGYIVYSGKSDNSLGPFAAAGLIEEITSLPEGYSEGLSTWRSSDRLEVRAFLDTDIGLPPLSTIGLFRPGRERTRWYVLEHPEMEER